MICTLHLFTGLFLTIFFSLFLIFSHFLPGRQEGVVHCARDKECGEGSHCYKSVTHSCHPENVQRQRQRQRMRGGKVKVSHTRVMLNDTQCKEAKRCMLQVSSQFPAPTSYFSCFWGARDCMKTEIVYGLKFPLQQ